MANFGDELRKKAAENKPKDPFTKIVDDLKFEKKVLDHAKSYISEETYQRAESICCNFRLACEKEAACGKTKIGWSNGGWLDSQHISTHRDIFVDRSARIEVEHTKKLIEQNLSGMGLRSYSVSFSKDSYRGNKYYYFTIKASW